MRLLPIACGVTTAVVLAAAAWRAGPIISSHGPVPTWALFSFAVSAFREPLR